MKHFRIYSSSMASIETHLECRGLSFLPWKLALFLTFHRRDRTGVCSFLCPMSYHTAPSKSKSHFPSSSIFIHRGKVRCSQSCCKLFRILNNIPRIDPVFLSLHISIRQASRHITNYIIIFPWRFATISCFFSCVASA